MDFMVMMTDKKEKKELLLTKMKAIKIIEMVS